MNENDGELTRNQTDLSGVVNEHASKNSDAYVTVNEFTNFQTEIKQQITDVKNDTELFGINTGNILIASLVLNLILLLVVIVIRSGYLKANDTLRQKINTQRDKLETLSDDVRSFKRELSRRNDFPVANVAPPVQKNIEIPSVTAFPPPSSEKMTPPPPKPEDKYKNFIEDFKELSNQKGFAAKDEAEKFVKKYNVRAFSCANVADRMNDPIPPPVFAEAPINNADFWAYEFESGVYAVVPRIKNYTTNYHSDRAVGEVFSSNFDKGNTYSKIFVKKPAIFKGMWNLQQKGELELSK